MTDHDETADALANRHQELTRTEDGHRAIAFCECPTAVAYRVETCRDCFGSGFYKGIGGPCPRGCPVPTTTTTATATTAVVDHDTDDEERPAPRDLDAVLALREDLDEDEARALLAVALSLDLSADAVEDADVSTGALYGYGYQVEADGEEWAVCTDDEADLAWEESLDNYLDECVLPGLDGNSTLSTYFDREGWKSDARHDGRGHCLSSYDGGERDQEAGGAEYFLYRMN